MTGTGKIPPTLSTDRRTVLKGAAAISALGSSLLHSPATAKESKAGLHDLGLAAAAAAIRKGEIASEALAEALLSRARQYASLKSFIAIDEGAVLSAARAADKSRARGVESALLGVPFGVKDSYLTRGLKTSFGTGVLKDYVPTRDAAIVASIKASGGIVLGKNNLVEMSYGLTGVNAHYGQPKNPYNVNHVTGGSSSGAGASVAARLVPAALGGDTVGSIRVPASLCGVVGYKPTNGRWPGDGIAPISHTLDTGGVLARSVEDCVLLDSIVTGEKRDAAASIAGLKGVRLAIAPKQFHDLVDESVDRTFKNTLVRLKDAGADIVEVDLGAEFSDLARKVNWSIFFGETSPDIKEFLKANGIPATFEDIYGQLTPEVKGAWSKFVLPTGDSYLPEAAVQSIRSTDRAKLQALYAAAFAKADALILPTTRCYAPETAKQENFVVAGKEQNRLFLSFNTYPASAVGIPDISVPMGLSPEKLPVGLSIQAAAGADRSLLSLAQRIETVIGSIPAPTGLG